MAIRASWSLGGTGWVASDCRQSRSGSSNASNAPEIWASRVKVPHSRARPAASARRGFWFGSGAGGGAGLEGVRREGSSTAEGALMPRDVSACNATTRNGKRPPPSARAKSRDSDLSTHGRLRSSRTLSKRAIARHTCVRQARDDDPFVNCRVEKIAPWPMLGDSPGLFMTLRRAPTLNLPNQLTVLRLGMCGLLIISMSFDWPYAATTALLIFTAASLTDWLDGAIARARNLVTDLGKLLDPLADKILIIGSLAALLERHIAPMWMVDLIIARAFLITGLRGSCLHTETDHA